MIDRATAEDLGRGEQTQANGWIVSSGRGSSVDGKQSRDEPDQSEHGWEIGLEQRAFVFQSKQRASLPVADRLAPKRSLCPPAPRRSRPTTCRNAISVQQNGARHFFVRVIYCVNCANFSPRHSQKFAVREAPGSQLGARIARYAPPIRRPVEWARGASPCAHEFCRPCARASSPTAIEPTDVLEQAGTWLAVTNRWRPVRLGRSVPPGTRAQRPPALCEDRSVTRFP